MTIQGNRLFVGTGGFAYYGFAGAFDPNTRTFYPTEEGLSRNREEGRIERRCKFLISAVVTGIAYPILLPITLLQLIFQLVGYAFIQLQRCFIGCYQMSPVEMEFEYVKVDIESALAVRKIESCAKRLLPCFGFAWDEATRVSEREVTQALVNKYNDLLRNNGLFKPLDRQEFSPQFSE
jgi:hypothetical protein